MFADSNGQAGDKPIHGGDRRPRGTPLTITTLVAKM
jgi:hypothetical protein